MEQIDLEGIRARADATVSGEWYAAKDGETVWCRVPNFGDLRVAGGMDREEAEFIAHARQDIPDLLDEVERLQSAHIKIRFEGKEYTPKQLCGRLRKAEQENERLRGLLDRAVEDMRKVALGKICSVCSDKSCTDRDTMDDTLVTTCASMQWRGLGEREGG